jgi:protocatechuate 3,4-dioxygenase beta subunit
MTRRIGASAIGALALTLQARAPAQTRASTAPTATTVSGRVIANADGTPIWNARITLAPSSVDTPVVLSDDGGRFTISISTDSRQIIVTKAGYARIEVPLSTEPLTIRLHSSGIITGTITDESGDPVVGAVVRAEPVRAGVTRPSSSGTITDDRGEYRFALPAGRYLISAARIYGIYTTVEEQRPRLTYYPGVSNRDDAEGITVDEGSEQSGIGLTVPLSPGAIPFPGPYSGTVGPPIAPPLDEPSGRGAINGHIVTTDGHSVPRAFVMLTRAGEPPRARPITTDENGYYAFPNLPVGRFMVTAFKPGYLGVAAAPTTAAFRGDASQRLVALEDAQPKTDIDVMMVGGGTISGQVFDELGEPLEGARVELLQLRYESGRRRLVGVAPSPPLTDDRGVFRLYGIRPGQYVVSASASEVNAAQLPYARMYFPGASYLADAQYVRVRPSENVGGLFISMRRIRTFSVSGILRDSSGQPTTGGTVQLLPSYGAATAVSIPISARISDDGRFAFPGVLPGEYVIRADRGRRNGFTEGEFATVPVTVTDANIDSLVVQTTAGSSLSGRILFDAAADAQKPLPNAIEITPVPVDFDRAPNAAASADIHDDWTFELYRISGARRLEVERLPPGWALEEIRVNGVVATDRPIILGRREQSLTEIEVVLTDRVASISGKVNDDHERPVEGVHVVLFAIDRDLWYPGTRFLKIAATKDDGTFVIAPVPAGQYYGAAIARLPDTGDDGWRDPEYLDALIRRATTLAVVDGEKRTLSLQLTSEER